MGAILIFTSMIYDNELNTPIQLRVGRVHASAYTRAFVSVVSCHSDLWVLLC